MTRNPFTRHQHQVAKWQPSARLFGRQLWRALVRHARDRDTAEMRGRAPMTAAIPGPVFGPQPYDDEMAATIMRLGVGMLDSVTRGTWQRIENDVLWSCRTPT